MILIMLLCCQVKTQDYLKQSSGLLLFVSILTLSENAFVSFQGSCYRQIYLEFYVVSFFYCEPYSGLEEPVILISFPEIEGICCLLFQFQAEFSIRLSIPNVCLCVYC